jgi:hypothetical protein
VPNRKTSVLYSTTPEVSGLKSLAVNGKSLNPKIEHGYAAITREWKAGDKIDLVLPMSPQRIEADEKIGADAGLVALRYGPLIYNVERADQPDIGQPIGAGPLATEWRGDLLDGVEVIKGKWADGSPLLAIPNYARNNRAAQAGRSASEGGGDSTIDYSGGATVGTSGANAANSASTNAASAGAGRAPGGRVNRGEGGSMVWIKEHL